MCPEQPTDDQLMARLRGGDQDAFAELVRRYQRALLNFFVRLGAQLDEADDLAQETFLRVYGYRHRYAGDERFKSFLYVLARHARADLLRRSKRSTEVASDALETSPDSGRPHTAGVEAKLDVQKALSGLSEKLRMVVVLGVLQGMEYRDIAEVLEIPVGTVKSRMHLAMLQLREELHVDEA
jgi:RNA polymerase sigma-70 factor (ECF subfamily)